MAKKSEQWDIDRAFYSPEKLDSVGESLKDFYNLRNGTISYDELIGKLIEKNITTTQNRYEQSTQTFYKKMGLIRDRRTIGGASTLFAEGKITFKELLVFSLFKFQFRRRNQYDYPVRPFIVLLIIFKKLLDYNENLAWIDCYDYLEFLTEIKSYNDIDHFFNLIVNAKENNTPRTLRYDVMDWDALSNVLVYTGLFIRDDLPNASYAIRLNKNEINFVDHIIEHHLDSPLFAGVTDQDWFDYLSSDSGGLFDLIPYYEKKNPVPFNLIGFEKTAIAASLYYTLVDGEPMRKTDDLVFVINASSKEQTKGFITQDIVKAYGVPTAVGPIDPLTNARGIFKGFVDHIHLLTLSSHYQPIKDVVDMIISYKEGGQINMAKKSYDFSKGKKGGESRVIYGTPGCGKSYYVDNTYLKKLSLQDEESIIRTTFYQDYSNTDFVGQVLPRVNADKTVTYDFFPGPFTIALREAIRNPEMDIALVIEELNRGNAASIFGDIFQLLDRDDNGVSVYKIINVPIQDYLNKFFESLPHNPLSCYSFNYIKLPSNLYIVATMNTSDQNVFTLDMAFKRRWNSQKLSNEFDSNHPFKGWYVPGMENEDITWEDFVVSINENFINKKQEMFMNEDKQIGVYFVDKRILAEQKSDVTQEKKKAFAHKVFEYLWDDITKLIKKEELFKNPSTLDKLINDYVNGKQVFQDDIIKKI